ncbi:MAG: metalloprotease TldD [Mariprofundales bacterium]|nr:metalloprotease TldD [Mariprofundales bacterium]
MNGDISALPVSEGSLQQALAQLLSGGADDGDLYLQSASSESLALEEGRVKQLSASSSQGVGVRVITGDRSGHAFTDRLEHAALMEAAGAARAIASGGGSVVPVNIHAEHVAPCLYQAVDPAAEVDFGQRKVLLEQLDTLARELDPRVRQLFASISSSLSDIHIIRMDGGQVHDVRPLVRLNVSVVVEESGRRESGSAGGGGRFSLQRLIASGEPQRLVREAVRIATVNLGAHEAPAGTMPVVLAPGWPGILLHEAIGHGLEGDFNRKGSSVFADKMGKRVAARGVTVVDDGTIAERRGSLSVDDEGTPGQRTVLIEDGILTAYLCDRHNGRLLGTQSTGNGRRESYAHPVLPRMTNTFMLAGSESPQDILASLDRGIYAVNFGGGQVDITSGNFVFTTSEAYYVEQGVIQYPVKGATLIGSGHEVLQRVSMIGDDLQLDPGIGTCGKEGQSVPVGVGLPTIRIDELTVGGTQC